MNKDEKQIWQEIDHELVKLKIVEASDRLSAENRNRIREAKALHRNWTTRPGSLISELSQILVASVQKRFDAFYGIYQEVWQLQGQQITPEFIRVFAPPRR